MLQLQFPKRKYESEIARRHMVIDLAMGTSTTGCLLKMKPHPLGYRTLYDLQANAGTSAQKLVYLDDIR